VPDALVGIIGASGEVGRVVARELLAAGVSRLRIGARDVVAVRRQAGELERSTEVEQVDVRDRESLARFCRECRVVVNCAGPSLRLLDLAVDGALAAGADYVDPGGDQPLHRRLANRDLRGSGRVALLAAGMMPGLSALLVRWLALWPFDRMTRLLAYVGGRDRLSPAGAIDYILSLGQAGSKSLSIWRDGTRAARAVSHAADLNVPFFPASATFYPYLSAETERLARALRLSEALWYNVFEGGHMSKALGQLQGAMQGETDVADAAAELSKAAELDLFGLPRYQLFYLQLEGESDGSPFCRGIVLRGASASELTGCMAALAAECLLERQIEPGLHFAGEALAPLALERLRRMKGVTAFQPIERGAAEIGHLVERGEL
jgi:hypothetical protein